MIEHPTLHSFSSCVWVFKRKRCALNKKYIYRQAYFPLRSTFPRQFFFFDNPNVLSTHSHTHKTKTLKYSEKSMVYALTVVVELTSVAALPRFVAAFEALHTVSNSPNHEPGCLSYELLRANDDPKTVIILERFVDQDAHKTVHRSSGPFQAFSVWLRGEAMRADLEGGPIVAKVTGRHFVSSGECLTTENEKVEISEELVRLSKVERVVRIDVAKAAIAPAATAAAAAAAPALVDPASFAYKPVCDGVLVFGGARNGAKPEYVEAAEMVGASVGATKRPFIYGAGNVGVMAAAARGAQAAGSKIIGIIPEALFPRELSGDCFGTVVVTQDMNERKRLMFAASSSIICLPGGVGTLDELFEAITLFQLNAIRHKIMLVNVAGFFDPLVALLQRMIAEGFVEEKIFNYIHIYNGNPAEAMAALEAMHLSPPAAALCWKKQ